MSILQFTSIQGFKFLKKLTKKTQEKRVPPNTLESMLNGNNEGCTSQEMAIQPAAVHNAQQRGVPKGFEFHYNFN